MNRSVHIFTFRDSSAQISNTFRFVVRCHWIFFPFCLFFTDTCIVVQGILRLKKIFELFYNKKIEKFRKLKIQNILTE